MAITNNDGFNFINTILRKEKNGSSLTPDRFNNLLNFTFNEVLSDEYSKFEKSQKSTDFFRFLKITETFIPGLNDESYDLTSLSNDYFHIIGLKYKDADGYFHDIDIVTSDEWNNRLSSSLEYPTAYFPICKISGDDMYFYPIADRLTTNLVTNSGYFEEDGDWVIDTEGNVVDWHITYDNIGSIGKRYWFEGGGLDGFRKRVLFYNFGYDVYKVVYDKIINQPDGGESDLIPDRNYYYYFEYAVSDYGGGADIDLDLELWGNKIHSITGITSGTTRTIASGTAYFLEYNPNTDGKYIQFYFYQQVPQNVDLLYIDRVFVGIALDFYISYIKKPETPYFDWYYDANDRIQYLAEGLQYTLLTDETYIDKSDGSVLTSGSVIGSIADGDDADNCTVEMDIPDDERRRVFNNMVMKLGVSLDKANAIQYSSNRESKELSK